VAEETEQERAQEYEAGSRERGVVKWFNDSKGYGFIAVNGKKQDIFVHFSAIQSQGFKSLKEGDEVAFVRVKTAKGDQANEVVVLSES
jgi:CspA family cold shock protein